jgi:hypothetical protein
VINCQVVLNAYSIVIGFNLLVICSNIIIFTMRT